MSKCECLDSTKIMLFKFYFNMFFGNNHLLFLFFSISGWNLTTLLFPQLQETVYNTTQFKSFCASYDLAVSGPWMFKNDLGGAKDGFGF